MRAGFIVTGLSRKASPMFDARSILEGLVRGAGPVSGGRNPDAQAAEGGGLGDILGQILNGGQPDAAGGRGAPAGGGGGGGIGDILGQILNRGQGDAPAGGGAQPDGDQSGGGGLNDLLRQIQDQIGGASGGTGQGGGGIMDVLGQVLGQATDGVREGAQKFDTATGASDALGRATGGQTPEQLVERLRDFIRTNPIAAGAAATGLGGLILGTGTGRSLAAGAAQIGALALIGGLAYKAVQNYQAGKPLISRGENIEAAPPGSGYEPAAVTNDDAILYIRAMVAAAAADGRVDDAEQQRIVGSLRQAGMDREAEAFIADTLNNPPSIAALAASVKDAEHAAQVYTAARIAIDVNDAREVQFLRELADALGIDPQLAAHIDASARAAAA